MPAWFLSIILHLALLVLIAILTIPQHDDPFTLTLTSTVSDPVEQVDPNEFEFSEIPVEDIGAESASDVDVDISEAPEIAEKPEVTADILMIDSAPLEFNPTEEKETGQ